MARHKQRFGVVEEEQQPHVYAYTIVAPAPDRTFNLTDVPEHMRLSYKRPKPGMLLAEKTGPKPKWRDTSKNVLAWVMEEAKPYTSTQVAMRELKFPYTGYWKRQMEIYGVIRPGNGIVIWRKDDPVPKDVAEYMETMKIVGQGGW